MELSIHALEQIADRKLDIAWIEATLREPSFVRPDKYDPEAKWAFRRIPEKGDRWLRVVYTERRGQHLVITVFFDRKAEKWR